MTFWLRFKGILYEVTREDGRDRYTGYFHRIRGKHLSADARPRPRLPRNWLRAL